MLLPGLLAVIITIVLAILALTILYLLEVYELSKRNIIAFISGSWIGILLSLATHFILLSNENNNPSNTIIYFIFILISTFLSLWLFGEKTTYEDFKSNLNTSKKNSSTTSEKITRLLLFIFCTFISSPLIAKSFDPVLNCETIFNFFSTCNVSSIFIIYELAWIFYFIICFFWIIDEKLHKSINVIGTILGFTSLVMGGYLGLLMLILFPAVFLVSHIVFTSAQNSRIKIDN